MTSYKDMTIEHLGSEATERDLRHFRSLCQKVQSLYPEWDDDKVTEQVFGNGNYIGNAGRLIVIRETKNQSKLESR